MDETYVRVKGRWTYLYRAVDSRGQTIDFLLAARRDTAAAKRTFFRKAIAQPHVANPRTLTVDKNPSYPRAVADMKSDGQLSRRTCLRQCRHTSTTSSSKTTGVSSALSGLGSASAVSIPRGELWHGFRNHGDDEEGTASKD